MLKFITSFQWIFDLSIIRISHTQFVTAFVAVIGLRNIEIQFSKFICEFRLAFARFVFVWLKWISLTEVDLWCQQNMSSYCKNGFLKWTESVILLEHFSLYPSIIICLSIVRQINFLIPRKHSIFRIFFFSRHTYM